MVILHTNSFCYNLRVSMKLLLIDFGKCDLRKTFLDLFNQLKYFNSLKIIDI